MKTVDNGDLFDLIGQGAQQLLQMALCLLGGHAMHIGGNLFGFHAIPFEKPRKSQKRDEVGLHHAQAFLRGIY